MAAGQIEHEMLMGALAYATQGYRVFPCQPRGKQPITTHGLRDATTNTDKIRAWWAQTPTANVAVACGGDDHLVVLDVDNPAALSDLEERIGALPATLTTSTGRNGGGRHYWFRGPEGIVIGNRRGTLPGGIDVRGEGGYVIAPPSWHPDGIRYAVASEHQVAEIPGSLIGILIARVITPRVGGGDVPAVRSNATHGRTSLYGQRALDLEVERLRQAPEGRRNESLNSAAFNVGQLVAGGEVDEDQMRDALVGAAQAIGLEEREITATLQSGLNGGSSYPRSSPERGAVRTFVIAIPAAEGAPGDREDDHEWLKYEPWSVFRHRVPEDVSYYVHELVIRGGIGVIGAPAKAGKTWLAEHLALCIANGKNFHQWAINEPHRVLYLALEGSATGHATRFKVLARGIGVDPLTDETMEENLNIVTQPPRGLNLVDIVDASAFVQSVLDGRFAVVFIDVARAAAKIRESGEGTYDLRAIQSHLRPLMEAGVTTIFVHHAKKVQTASPSTYTPALERLSGSGDWGGVVDVGLVLEKGEEGWRDAVLHVEGRDIPTPPTKLRIRYDGDGSGENGAITALDTITPSIVEDDEGADERNERAIQLAVWLGEKVSREATTSEVMARLGISRSTLRRMRRAIHRQGIVIIEAAGQHSPTIYSRP